MSQKIRHIKWKIKRKKSGIMAHPIRVRRKRDSDAINFKLRSVRRKVDHRYTPSKLYRALLKELREGFKSNAISEYRILEILKQTNKGRRTWAETLQRRKISCLVAEYPCFTDAKYVSLPVYYWSLLNFNYCMQLVGGGKVFFFNTVSKLYTGCFAEG